MYIHYVKKGVTRQVPSSINYPTVTQQLIGPFDVLKCLEYVYLNLKIYIL